MANRNIWLKKLIFFLISIIMVSCSPQKEKVIDVAAFDQNRILAAADLCLNEKPITVTAAYCERSAGGLNDYYSEGDYWWPDLENPDGPYIRKDGQTNPGNFTAHRKAMRNMSVWVPTLVAAYKISGEEKYARAALKHLLAWFVTPETRMNPNLLYAQAIMGRVTGRGIGIIDTLHLAEVARAIKVLEDSGYLSGPPLEALKAWFMEYLHWMTTHEYGIAERDHGNNHSTCWAVQVGAFASLVENEAQLDYCQTMYREVLLPDQMAPDGSFPREMDRTKPYGYSLFNLEVMAMLVHILSTPEKNLWQFKLEDGRGIGKGIAFMYPYILDKSTWKMEPDVMYHDQWPVRHPFLLFGGLELGHPEYIELWKSLDPDPGVEEVIRNFPFRQPVLWLKE
jgi:hypothetical protein